MSRQFSTISAIREEFYTIIENAVESGFSPDQINQIMIELVGETNLLNATKDLKLHVLNIL